MRSHRRDAFETLCREEYARVVRTAYLITGDREEAMDLAQEAFARAYARWRTVSQMHNPAAWLQRVVANLAISWHRRQRVRSRLPLPAEPYVDEPRLPDPELMDALRALSPAQRVVIVLRYFADQSSEDVARALGKRPGTVRALTAKGLARLRERLPQQEVNSEARG